MDKELLRIVIIATGLLIIVGMLVWGYLKNQYRPEAQPLSFADLGQSLKSLFKRDSVFDELPDTGYGTPPDDFSYAGEANAYDSDDYDTGDHGFEDHDLPSAPHKPQRPRLIQLSLVANGEQGFNGATLDQLFHSLGLEYGSVKVYERLDAARGVDFSVASMVNPGTFPEADLDNFYTPGISFFMQPQLLADPATVFDEMIMTIDSLASQLDGVIWDADRKLLNDLTFNALRASVQ